MKTYLKIQRLPIPLAFLIILTSMLAGVVFINRIQYLSLRAFSENSPKFLKITNIGDSSFVVSWVTEEKTQGSVSFGENASFGKTDQEKSFTHFVKIENLKPSTKYFFKIISEGKLYDDSGQPFEVTTAVQLPPKESDIAQGRILESKDLPKGGAIVYLSLANTITQAALTDNNGHWVIALSNARTLDLKSYSNYDREGQIEEIFVQGEKQTASAVLTTGDDNPAPDITLGQTYNFLNQPKGPVFTPTPAKSTSFGSQEGFSDLTSAQELSILFPSENEAVNSLTPEFIGSGPKNQLLTVEVESTQAIKDAAKIDSQGKWNWSPAIPLSVGKHKITVSYTDKEGFLRKITRNFTVLAAGESDLPSFTATPSGQTVTPTLSPSPSPTPISSPTPTSAAPGRTTVPSTPSETPASGNFLPTSIFLGAGIAAVLLGIILLLL